MANPESHDSFREVFPELERLVEVWKNLRHSDMNFEPITDLITQKLVGLGTLGDNDLLGTSLKDIGRLVDIRNMIIELDICSTRNYGEHWLILDAYLKNMIAMSSPVPSMDPEYKSDLDCLEILEEWSMLGSKMTRYPAASPESGSLLDHVIVVGVNNLWKAFEKGLVVKDDVNSMKALEIAASLRDTLRPQFHMWIDKIIAQKLRILSIRQASKSDPSLNDIVQSMQKPSALPEEQDYIHEDSNKQDIGFSNRDSEAAVSNVELGHLELNEQDLGTVAWVHDHDRDFSIHPPPDLDQRELDAHTASLLSQGVAERKELKQVNENSDRSIQELESENHDLILHIETLEEDLRIQETLTATLKTREANSEMRIRDMKEDYAKIKEELRQMTVAHEDRKAHAMDLHNDLVKERLSQITKAVKIDEPRDGKEALSKELRETRIISDGTEPFPLPQWFSDHSGEDVVKVKEQKNDPYASSLNVPSRLRTVQYARSVAIASPKTPKDENDWSSSCVGEATPSSSNGSVQLTNKSWNYRDVDMAGESGFRI